MSRTLARLRETTGDPLLVRAGRGLVPTPRALELAERVSRLVQDGEAVLRPQKSLDLARLVRTFTLRTSDGFVENVGPAILARVRAEAPGVRLRFVQKSDKDGAPLRDGAVDIETGVVETTTAPDLRAHALFRDRLVGAVRAGHPLSKVRRSPPLTTRRASTSPWLGRVSSEAPSTRPWSCSGSSDETAIIVGGFSSALALARSSDLIATVPERHTGNLRAGMHSFPLPVSVPEMTVSLLWHPRLDADPAHRWLRRCVLDACVTSLGPSDC